MSKVLCSIPSTREKEVDKGEEREEEDEEEEKSICCET